MQLIAVSGVCVCVLMLLKIGDTEDTDSVESACLSHANP